MSFQPVEPTPNPAVVANNRRFTAPKQSLAKLSKWRTKWVNAQRRGLIQRPSETADEFNQRSLTFLKKCGDAITEIERAMSARTTKPVRSSLPKKLQRQLGILPPVGHKPGELVPHEQPA